jgi:hypothetical protein
MKRQLNQTTLFFSWLSLLIAGSQNAFASDVSICGSIGLGGAGVTNIVYDPSTGANVPVARSESPGVFSLSVDYPLSDRWLISVEETRGFRVTPFSSGAGFLGLAARWFFLSPVPQFSNAKAQPDFTRILIQGFAPYIGLGAGVASATVDRTNDQIPEVTNSGVYTGFKLGAEYPLSWGSGLRIEAGSSQTFSSTSGVTGAFLQLGLYLYL